MLSLEELSRLDGEGAMQLLFAYTTDIKRYDKDIEALEKEIALWTSRVSLAESKGMAALADGARGQVAQLQARLAELRGSRSELEGDASRIREALPSIKAKRRSIDPDQLQAELSMMTGEALDPGKASLEKELGALEAAQAEDPLAALKRKHGL
jgi:TolA-binding protein